MYNKLRITNPFEDSTFRKVKFVEHDLPDEFKRNEWAWMKEEASRELYMILDQATYPCVVSIKENIVENESGSFDTYKMMDKLMIEIFISPVTKKIMYSMPEFVHLNYEKEERKESIWKKIWKSLQH